MSDNHKISSTCDDKTILSNFLNNKSHLILNFYGKDTKQIFNIISQLPDPDDKIIIVDNFDKIYDASSHIPYIFIDATNCQDFDKYIVFISESLYHKKTSSFFVICSNKRLYAYVMNFFQNTRFVEVD